MATAVSSVETADVATTAVCGSFCFCAAAVATALAAETADAAANSAFGKTGSTEPVFLSNLLF